MTGFVSSDPLDNLTNVYQRPIFIPADRIPTTNDLQPPGTFWQNGIGGNIYQTKGQGIWALSNSSTSNLFTLSGDTGTATPSSNNIAIVGTSGKVSTVGSGAQIAINLIGPYTPATFTAYAVITGGTTSGGSLQSIASVGTSGQVLTSNGAGALPTFQNAAITSPVSVANGGTGDTTLTAHGVLIGEGTSPVAATSAGTSGQPLLSGGASADPNWGTLSVAFGGTGATTLTGVLTGNGTSAITASAVTQFAVLVGGASNAVGSIADVAVGQALMSGGVSANPAYTGSPSFSGSVTAATTLTATSGNITATAGNFVSTAAGNGIVLNSGTASGTTAATLNGRSGQVTITTPSIAAGATFTFTITNSSVTASTTQVLYGLTGGTTGSAITIQSVTNSASSSVVVLQNASAVTANTGSLVLTFLVLN